VVRQGRAGDHKKCSRQDNQYCQITFHDVPPNCVHARSLGPVAPRL
jgi:hypothetical protein